MDLGSPIGWVHLQRTVVKGGAVSSGDSEGAEPDSQEGRRGASLVARAAETMFALHPPDGRAFAYRDHRFLLLIPFAASLADVKTGAGRTERVRFRRGALLMLDPGTALQVEAAEPAEFLVIAFEPALVASLAASGTRPWQPAPVRDLLDPAIVALATELRRAMLADPASSTDYLDMLGRTLLVRVGCHMLEDIVEDAAREALSPGKLARIMQYIDAHLHERISAEVLAQMAGLSRSHFSRAFQRMTGDPPQRFILKRRVCRARDLLSGGDAPIAQIAFRSGFSSQAHLSSAFREDVGTTPSRYRAAFRDASSA